MCCKRYQNFVTRKLCYFEREVIFGMKIVC